MSLSVQVSELAYFVGLVSVSLGVQVLELGCVDFGELSLSEHDSVFLEG